MAKDRLLFLFSFLMLGLVGAFLFRHDDASAASLKPSEDNSVTQGLNRVLVAEKDLNHNERLPKGAVVWETIDVSELNPSYVTWSPQTEKLVEEAVVLHPLHKGEKIKRTDILWPHEKGLNIEEEIAFPKSPGMRAVPFELTSRAAIAQFMTPGMFVDITFTSKTEEGFGSVSVTLLDNIRVLAMGRAADGTPFNRQSAVFKPNTNLEVLLEMTPRQAEILFFAQQTGVVSLVLSETKQHDSTNGLVSHLLKSDSIVDFQSAIVTHMMRTLFPKVNIKITATPKGYIVGGKVPDPQMAGKILEILEKLAPGGDKAIVNMMEVDPQQVLLCVRVFEVDKSLRLNLGINWELLFHNGCEKIALAAVYPRPPIGDPNFVFKGKGIEFGNFNLCYLIDMLEKNGSARVLAEPNLTTVSGKTAHFFAGGEFPILIPQGGNLIGTVTVDFKKYGVSLDFTPFVDLNGLITLGVTPEISTLDRENGVVLSGFVIPGLISRRVDTVVKLWPGQCYIIAGLLQDEWHEVDDSLYCLDQLPIIGPLFRSVKYQDHQTELMVIVTPYLLTTGKDSCDTGYTDTGFCDTGFVGECCEPVVGNGSCCEECCQEPCVEYYGDRVAL